MTITIKTDLDLTPTGKRRAIIGAYNRPIITWYVSNRIFRTLPATIENQALTNEWLNSTSDTDTTMSEHIDQIRRGVLAA